MSLMDIILMFLILSLVILTTILIIIFDKDSFDCLANPINYFQNLKNLTCSCQERTEWNSLNISNFSFSDS